MTPSPTKNRRGRPGTRFLGSDRNRTERKKVFGFGSELRGATGIGYAADASYDGSGFGSSPASGSRSSAGGSASVSIPVSAASFALGGSGTGTTTGFGTDESTASSSQIGYGTGRDAGRREATGSTK